MKRFFVILLIIAIGAASQPFFAFSEYSGSGGTQEEISALNTEIQAKKDKIKQIEETISAYKKKIEEKRTEAVSLSNQLAILDNRIAQVELDIEATQATLEAVELEIKQLQLSIDEKQVVVDRQKEILSELIRLLHYQQTKKTIEVLAVYDSFSEFYTNVQHLENLERNLGKQAKAIRLAKEDLEAKRGEQEKRRESYKELTKKLETQREDLDQRIDGKEVLLAAAQSSELEYKTVVNNLKKQYQAVEGEISSIEKQVRQKLESEKKITKEPESATGEVILSWPVNSRYVTAYFYDPSYPYRNVFEHNAIDIAVGQGTPVRAAASGYVARAKRCTTSSCYAYVMIVHSGGISTVYGHLSRIDVAEDQFVTRGDVIGLSGAKPGTIGAGPFTTGAHLHFETRKNGIPVNPLNYLGD